VCLIKIRIRVFFYKRVCAYISQKVFKHSKTFSIFTNGLLYLTNIN